MTMDNTYDVNDYEYANRRVVQSSPMYYDRIKQLLNKGFKILYMVKEDYEEFEGYRISVYEVGTLEEQIFTIDKITYCKLKMKYGV